MIHRYDTLTPEQEAEQLTDLLPELNRTYGKQKIVFKERIFTWITRRKEYPISIYFFEVSQFVKEHAHKYVGSSDEKKERKKNDNLDTL